jgi:hypothetical protein
MTDMKRWGEKQNKCNLKKKIANYQNKKGYNKSTAQPLVLTSLPSAEKESFR